MCHYREIAHYFNYVYLIMKIQSSFTNQIGGFRFYDWVHYRGQGYVEI